MPGAAGQAAEAPAAPKAAGEGDRKATKAPAKAQATREG